ncbi:predicted protein [Methanosarcina acetivorans C2A]|uniref:Uncharacterized protein n=1 Tax=Methanosarcina acetivorans (strain ATCC 35395 / DSM 2834 / JCM 12185 / C2A) TaxID=188937 RepID=Q8TNF4_METAC|nr:predicted protein [Methanosarcina acetivorans C2A]
MWKDNVILSLHSSELKRYFAPYNFFIHFILSFLRAEVVFYPPVNSPYIQEAALGEYSVRGPGTYFKPVKGVRKSSGAVIEAINCPPIISQRQGESIT